MKALVLSVLLLFPPLLQAAERQANFVDTPYGREITVKPCFKFVKHDPKDDSITVRKMEPDEAPQGHGVTSELRFRARNAPYLIREQCAR